MFFGSENLLNNLLILTRTLSSNSFCFVFFGGHGGQWWTVSVNSEEEDEVMDTADGENPDDDDDGDAAAEDDDQDQRSLQQIQGEIADIEAHLARVIHESNSDGVPDNQLGLDTQGPACAVMDSGEVTSNQALQRAKPLDESVIIDSGDEGHFVGVCCLMVSFLNFTLHVGPWLSFTTKCR